MKLLNNTQIKLSVLIYKTWNHLTVRKQMTFIPSKIFDLQTFCVRIIY